MILILFFIAIAIVVGYAIFKLVDADDHIIVWTFVFVTSIVSLVIAIVLTCMLINVQITESAELAAYQVRYDSLIYQLGMYDDEDYSKRDLYSEIERWNADLARRKKLRENVIIRDFQYNIDDFRPIEFPDS